MASYTRFYDGEGSYDPRQQSARDRYLDLLSRQRVNDQAMAKQTRGRQAVAEEEASYQGAGDMAAKGGAMGLQFSGGNPIAAVVGTILGKGVGAIQHGRKHGFGEGLKSFLDPTSTPKAFAGMGGDKTGSAGLVVGRQVDSMRNRAEADRRLAELERASGSGKNWMAELPPAPGQGTDPNLANLQFDRDPEVGPPDPYLDPRYRRPR